MAQETSDGGVMVVDMSNDNQSKKQNKKFAQMLAKMGKRSISTAKNDANRRLETKSAIRAQSATVFDEFTTTLSLALDAKKRRALDPQYYLDFIVLLTIAYCGNDQIVSLYSETHNISIAELVKEKESNREYQRLVNEKNDIFAQDGDLEDIELEIKQFKPYKAQPWHLVNIELVIPIATNSFTRNDESQAIEHKDNDKENKDSSEDENDDESELESNRVITNYDFAVFGSQKLLPKKRFPYFLDTQYQWNVWNSLELVPNFVYDDENGRYLSKYEDILACVILTSGNYHVCVFSTRNGVYRTISNEEQIFFGGVGNSSETGRKCIKLSNRVIYSFWVQDEGVFGIAKNPSVWFT